MSISLGWDTGLCRQASAHRESRLDTCIKRCVCVCACEISCVYACVHIGLCVSYIPICDMHVCILDMHTLCVYNISISVGLGTPPCTPAHGSLLRLAGCLADCRCRRPRSTHRRQRTPLSSEFQGPKNLKGPCS